jgi:hypothetical protein
MTGIRVILWLLPGVLLWSGCAASTAWAEPHASRSAVVELLSGYEYSPTRQDLEGLGPGVPEVLMDMVTDPEMLKVQRLRALDLLQHYPDRSDVETFLTGLLSHKALPSGFQRIAMRSLGRAAKGRAVETLKPYLSSPDVHTREAAAQALYETGDPAIGTVLKSAAMKEPEPFLKRSMMKMGDEVEKGMPTQADREKARDTRPQRTKPSE